jgi:hypothetical protein
VKSEAELWAAAAEMIKQHGADACIFAGLEADGALVDGDLDQLHECQIIVRRIRTLLDRGEGSVN